MGTEEPSQARPSRTLFYGHNRRGGALTQIN
jgi:hypothetical protein